MGSRKILYVDMDNVLVDFESGIARLPAEIVQSFEGRLDEVPDIFSMMRPIDGAIEHAGALEAQPSGTLRLNMALGAARMLLEPLLLQYLRRYPAMALEIVTEGALVDVIGQGFDAGFRDGGGNNVG